MFHAVSTTEVITPGPFSLYTGSASVDNFDRKGFLSVRLSNISIVKIINLQILLHISCRKMKSC